MGNCKPADIEVLHSMFTLMYSAKICRDYLLTNASVKRELKQEMNKIFAGFSSFTKTCFAEISQPDWDKWVKDFTERDGETLVSILSNYIHLTESERNDLDIITSDLRNGLLKVKIEE